jgi:hypothetical protein
MKDTFSTDSNEPVTRDIQISRHVFVFIPRTSLCKTNAPKTKRICDMRYDISSRLVLILIILAALLDIESSLLTNNDE